MAFPPYSETPPSLSEYGFSYRSYQFGQNTNFEIQEVEGATLPVVRSGDAGRPRDHGAFVGLDVMGEREITIKGQLHNKTGTFQAALEALAVATVPGGDVQEPLFMNLPGYGTLATMARVRKRAMPLNVQFSLGNLADITLLFVASDPRWYVAPTLERTATVPSTISGFKFALSFPLTFGGGTTYGTVSVTNTGNIETRPILVVEGPCPPPSITNVTAAGEPTLAVAQALNAGDRLEIDTDLHLITYYPAGTGVGLSRRGALVPGSEWFTLAPGTSTLNFLTGGLGEGKLAVQYASAVLL